MILIPKDISYIQLKKIKTLLIQENDICILKISLPSMKKRRKYFVKNAKSICEENNDLQK